ncbi:MAG: dipeptide epimerase, partial [Candidatus Wallbacteria bacterium]|nr:dipeptide epimerase [Candidatus Wallbacteria bacterium]
HQGVGEASPNKRYGEDERTVGEAVTRAAAKIADMRCDLGVLGRALDRELGGRDLSARAGLEMALFDLVGKASQLGAHQLLALEAPRPLMTSFTIAIAEPEEMARRARAAAEFPVLKVKVGGPGGLAGLEAVRSARPDARLICDANEGWTLDAARQFLPRLAALGVEWLEQPLPAGDASRLGELRGLGVRVMADESLVTRSDLEALAGHVDGVNVKVAKVGGLGPAAAILTRARELGLATMLGCMIESTLGIAAAMQLSSLADFADLDGHLLIVGDPFEGLTCEHGLLRLQDGPGIGARRRG